MTGIEEMIHRGDEVHLAFLGNFPGNAAPIQCDNMAPHRRVLGIPDAMAGGIIYHAGWRAKSASANPGNRILA